MNSINNPENKYTYCWPDFEISESWTPLKRGLPIILGTLISASTSRPESLTNTPSTPGEGVRAALAGSVHGTVSLEGDKSYPVVSQHVYVTGLRAVSEYLKFL